MIQAYSQTDIGKKRRINQDYVWIRTEPVGMLQNLFILADGMGGHKAGDYASWFLTESLSCFIERSRSKELLKVFRSAVELANSLIYEKSSADPELNGMGSTLVMATIEDSTLTCTNVGDSRLYVVRNHQIDQVTVDHSYVEEMVAMGMIERDSEEYRHHKNLITRAVGVETKVRPDFFDYDLQDGDFILLCSDGLSNMVPDPELCRIVSGSGSLKEKTEELIRLANSNGGTDNIAVILISYQEGGDEIA